MASQTHPPRPATRTTVLDEAALRAAVVQAGRVLERARRRAARQRAEMVEIAPRSSSSA